MECFTSITLLFYTNSLIKTTLIMPLPPQPTPPPISISIPTIPCPSPSSLTKISSLSAIRPRISKLEHKLPEINPAQMQAATVTPTIQNTKWKKRTLTITLLKRLRLVQSLLLTQVGAMIHRKRRIQTTTGLHRRTGDITNLWRTMFNG